MSRIHFQIGLILSLSLLGGCSKQAENFTSPAGIDVARVGTIVISEPGGQKDCEAEIKASGGQILYRNELGVLFTNLSPEALRLAACKGLVTKNEKLELEKPVPVAGKTPAGKRPDLSTLLKLIPAEEIGARTFVKDHPNFDGRGVVIAVLDTGIELDHPALGRTSDGKDKILDFQDFSGEGRVELTPVSVNEEAFKAPNGQTYYVNGIGATNYVFGTFQGSSLAYAEELAAKDKFSDIAILAYKVGDKWRGRIDTNGDRNLGNETELYDFRTSRKFAKIGEKKSLTVSLSIADDGKIANLAFDDGSHGTHVAGIAAANDPAGLQGVAPGAQVILGKIGDNRLSGGSTTTASMVLAIDYAVQSKAHIVNMSYGIRAGSNIGKSTIDRYVDEVARAKGMVFAISAGNEGPGLLTIGVPAGANLAITNAAYISKNTARDNYGYLGVDEDRTWYFSSVGPRLDGGWKPTLLAPGSALSSIPVWSGSFANFRGTSMASPQTAGGLALLLSAAMQSRLPVDRASITRAVYQGAAPIEGLAWIEQGHGLMNVPQSYKILTDYKDVAAVEYEFSVNSPTSPTGKGAGIYVRASTMPENIFKVDVTPTFPKEMPLTEKQRLTTLKLEASAEWIKTPATFWLAGATNSFQVSLDPAILKQPGLYSQKIRAVEEATGRLAFEVPVTVVVPTLLTEANRYALDVTAKIKVGQTLRHFIEVPAGATAVEVNLSTDGPAVWGQLLDKEGRKVLELRDSESSSPQVPLNGSANVLRPGVYELDVVAPPTNAKAANLQVRVQLYSLTVTKEPAEKKNTYEVSVQNNYTAVKVTPEIDVNAFQRRSVVAINGNLVKLPIALGEEDRKRFSKVTFNVLTSKKYYDLMTDYPFRVFNAKRGLVASGGLELNSEIEIGELAKIEAGNLELELQGAFAQKAPESWAVELTETRTLAESALTKTFPRMLLEPAQARSFAVDLSSNELPSLEEYKLCGMVSLNNAAGKRVQETAVCRD